MAPDPSGRVGEHQPTIPAWNRYNLPVRLRHFVSGLIVLGAPAAAPVLSCPPQTVVTLRPPTVAAADTRAPGWDAAYLVLRVSNYLAGYLEDFSSVVAEEDYQQEMDDARSNVHAGRKLVSDLLLVRVDGPDVWVPFRDVISVDGKPVRERGQRLFNLFLKDPAKAMHDGLRITKEGARYNVGSVYRTVNVPTLPLVFLMPSHIAGFRFQTGGEEPVDGMPTARIDYKEVGHPTVTRRPTSGRGTDLPASGSLWVDRSTGRIVKTRVSITDGIFWMETTVTYRRDERLDLWVPAEMTETYRQRQETITCTARYSNFRRFQVTTTEQIKRGSER